LKRMIEKLGRRVLPGGEVRPVFHARVMLIVVLSMSLACGMNVVDGRKITPEMFKFKMIVRADSDGGGWRAVCIKARITNGNTQATGLCAFEVGTPLRMKTGTEVSLGFAQKVAAELANTAAVTVLRSLPPETMIGPACLAFRAEYHLLLRQAIDGSKVGECGRDAPVVLFDPMAKQ